MGTPLGIGLSGDSRSRHSQLMPTASSSGNTHNPLGTLPHAAMLMHILRLFPITHLAPSSMSGGAVFCTPREEIRVPWHHVVAMGS